MEGRATPSSGTPPPSEAEPAPATYTAWDGTVFEDLEAFMKYEMLHYTFKGETGESETRLPGEVDGQPFDLIGACVRALVVELEVGTGSMCGTVGA